MSDATKHQTKAGVEIFQCKMTNRPYLGPFASDLKHSYYEIESGFIFIQPKKES